MFCLCSGVLLYVSAVHYGLLPPSSGQALTPCLCGAVVGSHTIEESRSPDEGEELYGRWGKRSGQARPPTTTPIATAVGRTCTTPPRGTRSIRGPSTLLPLHHPTTPETAEADGAKASERGDIKRTRPMRRGTSTLMYHRPPTPPRPVLPDLTPMDLSHDD